MKTSDTFPKYWCHGTRSMYIHILFYFCLQVDKWDSCEKVIWQNSFSNLLRIFLNPDHKNHKTDQDILDTYSSRQCHDILRHDFPHPTATSIEIEFPIAYGILVYKGGPLLEQLLKAIYMPHNAYCLHVDVKASETFERAVKSMTRCLSNVFITKETVDVIWAHISIIQAQLNCMEDLLESSIKWKYFINLVGQDFPLYDNNGIVTALQTLQGKNNIESFPMPERNYNRTQFVHRFEKTGEFSHDYTRIQTSLRKEPPPYGLKLFKGSNHVALTRNFVQFILNDKKAKEFFYWLNDTFIPDEAFYATLQQIPGVPGGIHGNHSWIMRRLMWFDDVCYGQIVREICWLSVADLRWALSKQESKWLFIQKIPFDYDKRLLKCLRMAITGREYGQGYFP